MRISCNFCGVEHKDGKCLDKSKEHFVEAIKTHGMRANIMIEFDTE